MKKKSGILVLVLLLAVGFAAVSTSLVINGTIGFNTNEEEFNVYFSDALVNNVQDLSVIENNQTITFKKEMKSLGETYTLDYDVTNGSKNYDAKLEMTCTESNDYLSITNEFDVSTNLSATKTRSGKLTIELIKSYAGDEAKEVSITCTINANAVERDALSTEEPVQDLESQYYIGKVITIGTEKFNMVSETDDTVTMLAQYSLGADYRQSVNPKLVHFSESAGWEYTPGPKEIDIQAWSTSPKIYVNEYVSYLQSELSDTTITGNLITLSELKDLGCLINNNYSWGNGLTCSTSNNSSWLVNGQYWWTHSASADRANEVWAVHHDGALYYTGSNDHVRGIRPVITISKTTLENLKN